MANKEVNTTKTVKVGALRIILLAVLVLVIAAVVVIKVLPAADKTRSNLVLLETGNRGGNLAAGGTVLEVGGSVYLSESGSGRILKVDPGATTGAPLGELRGRYLNSDGTNLWYVDRDSDKLMKSDLNGAQPVEFLPCRVTMPMLVGDYIYFIDLDSNHTLSRIPKDAGSGIEIINAAARVRQYSILGENIFYHDLDGSGAAGYGPMDGSAVYNLDAMHIGQVLFSQGRRVYFSNQLRDGALDFYAVMDDGSYSSLASTYTGTVTEAVTNTGVITCAVADENHVYYVKAADGCLYRRPLNGKSAADIIEEKITDFPVYGVQDAGSHIYCCAVAENGAYYAFEKK